MTGRRGQEGRWRERLAPGAGTGPLGALPGDLTDAPMRETMTAAETDARHLYLDLMKKVLTRVISFESHRPFRRALPDTKPLTWAALLPFRLLSRLTGLKLYRSVSDDLSFRIEGRDWPSDGETMIGLKRLDNLQSCIDSVLADGIEGDFIETGVWRGGACIFMKAVLAAYGETTRKVWVADSFEGLPKPDGRYGQDKGDGLWRLRGDLGVGVEEVRENFRKYGLLDDNIRFLKGWFKDTLPGAPFEKLAIARLDGDMYSSTMDALMALYPKLSRGGYLIVDDYGACAPCEQAVQDYRREQGITTPIIPIDWTGVYWRKED